MLSDVDDLPYTWGGNVFGGKVKRKSKSTKSKSRKSSPEFKKWIAFNRRFRKAYKADRGKNPSAKTVSNAYRSANCGKKSFFSEGFPQYCKTKRKTRRKTKSASCKGYTRKLKSKSVGKRAKSMLRKKCVGYTKKKGKGLFGAGCAMCGGSPMGGCSCCGAGYDDTTPYIYGGAAKKKRRSGKSTVMSKKCVSTNSLYNRIKKVGKMIKVLQSRGADPSIINRYVGVWRQMIVLYKKQQLVGDKYITSSQARFSKYPGFDNWYDNGYFVR